MRRYILAALCAALCLTCAVHAQPSWAHGHGKHLVRLYKATLIEEPATHARFVARDLNNRGQVAGELHVSIAPPWNPTPDWPIYPHAAIWREGQVTLLPETESTFSSRASGLNDVGHVIGRDEEWTVGWGALWHGDTLSMVGFYEDQFVFYPQRVNNRGEIIADCGTDNRVYFAVNEGHTFSPLELTPGAYDQHGADINYRSHVVGSETSEAGTHAALWRDDTVEVLGLLPGMTDAEANGIDALDRIVGASWNSQSGARRAFLWRHGAMTALPLVHRAKGESSAALAINNWGQIVGQEQGAGNAPSRAVLWERGRAFDLNALIRPGSALKPHVTLRTAFRINEWGQILVSAQDDRVSDERFYLLTPAYEWR
jgi:uncharacterized membrane protein